MADEHGSEVREAPTARASRPDKDSVIAALGRQRSGAPETVSDDDDEPEVRDDTNDHGDDDEPAPRPKAKAKPKLAAVPDPEPEPDPPDEEPEVEAEAEIDPDAEPADEEPAEEAPKPDPELERRATALRRQEQRLRERVARERADVQRERDALKADTAELEKFKALRARAKYDPTAALRALGLTDEDLEPAARHIYAQTKEAAKDPKNREAADKLMRERELQSKTDELQKRLDALDEEKRTAQAAQANERAAMRYLGGVSKAARPGTLAAHFIAKGGAAADKVTRTFAQIAQELSDEGDLPDPADVLAEYEVRRREELEEADVDVDALLKRKPAAAQPAKKPGTPAVAATPARKPGAKPAPAAAAPTKKFKDLDERNDSILAEIQARRRKGALQ